MYQELIPPHEIQERTSIVIDQLSDADKRVAADTLSDCIDQQHNENAGYVRTKEVDNSATYERVSSLLMRFEGEDGSTIAFSLDFTFDDNNTCKKEIVVNDESANGDVTRRYIYRIEKGKQVVRSEEGHEDQIIGAEDASMIARIASHADPVYIKE